MRKKFLKSWPIIFLVVVWFIFSYPYFLNNKTPFPSEYLMNFFAPWSAYFGFSGPIKNNAMPDIITQIYPWKHLVIQSLTHGQIPLWNPFSFSGTPLMANYQSAVFSPFNLLFFILPFIDSWSILVLLQPLLAGLFMYLFSRSLFQSKAAGVISAISFMFCGFITTWMGYATLGYSILFLPLALYAIEKYFTTSNKIFLLVLSISIPLSFFSGHFQISIYFLIFIIIYLFYKTLSTKQIKKGAKAYLFLFFGFLLTLPQLIPSIESYLQSFRSEIFQKTEAIPWQYLATLIAPDFFGNPVTRNDWFGHYAEWNGYIGIIPLMLAVYSISIKKFTRTFFLFIIAILALILALNTPILGLIVSLKIPVLSTSAASRIIVIFSFVFSVLAGFGFDRLVSDHKERKIKRICLWLGVFFLFFILLWAIVIFKFAFPLDKLVIARQNLILPSIIFFLSVLIIASSILTRKKVILFLLIFFIVFDLLRFAIKWQSFDPKDLVFQSTPLAAKMSMLLTNERYLGGSGAYFSNYYGLPSVEGYDALYIRSYGQFIASLQTGKLTDSSRSVVEFPNNGLFTQKATNLLGIKYIVHKISDGQAPWVFPFWNNPKQFILIYKDQKYEIYKNNLAFPRTFLVNDYKVITDPENILKTMFSKDFNLRKEVVLEKEIGNLNLNKKEETGLTYIQKYSPNEIDVGTNSDSNSLLFISDSYYSGWNAYVDGNKTEIYRADFAFRAIPVEKGKHEVKIIYEPVSFKIGIVLAIFGGLGIILLLTVPRILNRKASFSS